jgi:flavin-dependent dehydrogenase
MTEPDFDAVVVGASVAGCTAARLFAQRGARVALVERRPDVDAYKTVCTHYIQPSATPTIEKLGLAALIEERGAVRNSIDLWTPYGGWIRHRGDAPYGYNVTRQILDPLLRRMTAETPGVELLSGHIATELLNGGGGPGVVVEDRHRARRALRGRLVVAADGRETHLARMAGVKGRVRPHNRFFYWAYWRGVEPADDRSRMWFMEPDCAYTFPNEDGLCLVLVAPHRDRLPEFRHDLDAAYMSSVAALPDAPDLTHATRESKLLGKLDLPNVSRPAARPGLAFVGDAALASDPLWGVGCGWALQSAEWLGDAVAPALAGSQPLDRALKRYRRRYGRGLRGHAAMIHDYAGGRRLNPGERMLFSAATFDERVSAVMEAFGTRNIGPVRMLATGAPLALKAHLRRRVLRRGRAQSPAAAVPTPASGGPAR